VSAVSATTRHDRRVPNHFLKCMTSGNNSRCSAKGRSDDQSTEYLPCTNLYVSIASPRSLQYDSVGESISLSISSKGTFFKPLSQNSVTPHLFPGHGVDTGHRTPDTCE